MENAKAGCIPIFANHDLILCGFTVCSGVLPPISYVAVWRMATLNSWAFNMESAKAISLQLLRCDLVVNEFKGFYSSERKRNVRVSP